MMTTEELVAAVTKVADRCDCADMMLRFYTNLRTQLAAGGVVHVGVRREPPRNGDQVLPIDAAVLLPAVDAEIAVLEAALARDTAALARVLEAAGLE